VNQAKILDALLKKQNVGIDRVVNLAIDDELLIKRVTGRLVHASSGRTYNIYFSPPRVEGKVRYAVTYPLQHTYSYAYSYKHI
jgi:adenylate kinase